MQFTGGIQYSTLFQMENSFNFMIVLLTSGLFACASADESRVCTYSTNPSTKMEKESVVPDVIPVAPKEVLNVIYEGGLKVDLGNELTPTQVKNPPTVSWNAEKSSLYTLCMTDPDAPSRKTHEFREWHHWLVGNIPGSNVKEGETLSEYVGSGPPKDTGLHRYVFLVYKQPGKLTFDEPRLTNTSADNRAKFQISKFAEKYKLGNPVAGNFYQAQWDDYVPLLYKQLGN